MLSSVSSHVVFHDLSLHFVFYRNLFFFSTNGFMINLRGGFRIPNFRGFRIPDSVTWGDLEVVSS